MTLVSLGCVTALFVNHVSTSYSGTIPMMVTFIPLLVHILLVRDIYVKWEDRWVGRTQCCRHQQITTRQTPTGNNQADTSRLSERVLNDRTNTPPGASFCQC